jgi:uncharacterized protein (DUF2384 family)
MMRVEVSEMAQRAVRTRAKSELEIIREKLLNIVQPQEAERWLTTPKKFLNGRTPLQAIEDGEGERLIRQIGRIEEGIPL